MLTIPANAVQRGTDGTYVYLVGADNKVSQRSVAIGTSENERVVVESGLKAGDRVVVEGTDRLRDGAKVEVVGGDEVIPAAKDKSLGGGAPAGTTPATR